MFFLHIFCSIFIPLKIPFFQKPQKKDFFQKGKNRVFQRIEVLENPIGFLRKNSSGILWVETRFFAFFRF